MRDLKLGARSPRVVAVRLTAATAVALAISALTMCAGGTSAASASGHAAATAASAAKGTNILKYVGGTAGAANPKLSPVTVGWVNTQGGPGGAPEATVAAQAAVKWINAKLGGIKGHPLKLATCFVTSTEEEVQQCGEQMVNSKAIKMVNVSYMQVVSGGPLYTLTGPAKPLFGTTASTPAEFGAKNAYFWFVDNYGANGISSFIVDEQHAQNVTVIAPSGPIGALAALTAGQIQGLGATVHNVTFTEGTTDLTGPLEAGDASSANVILPYVLAPDCIRIAQALQQLSVTAKVTTSPLCADPSVAAALGGIPVGWSFSGENALDTQDPDVALYRKELATYAGKKATAGGEAIVSFGLVMLDAKVLNKVGPNDITLSSVKKAADAIRGPLFLGPSDVQCGSVPGEPSACPLTTKMTTYLGNGKWNDYNGKGFFPPS